MVLMGLIPILSQAQISILNSDMPRVNDTLRYSNSTGTVNYLATDSNYTWDFSNLTVDYQDVQRYYSPFQTPYILQFSSATYGIPEANQNLGPLGGAASSIFSFYKTSSAALVTVGRGATVQGLPLGLVYNPRDTVFKYPLVYGKTFSGSYAGEASLLTLGTLKQSGTRNTQVDGWGSVTTPFGTFNCLRIKSTIISTDSVVFGSIGIPLPGSRTEYTWLAKNERYPIMEVIVNNLTSTITSIRFKDRYRPEAYRNNCNFTANKTIGKPGDTITLNNTSHGTPKSFNWQITPSTYVFAAGSGAGSEFPKVIFTAVGEYNVKLSVTYEGGSDDTTKLAYIKISEGAIVRFSANNTHPALNETVFFRDSSTGNPTAWLWTITPNTGVVFLNGTSNASQHPQVQFNQIGPYAVQLRITNASGNTSLKLDNYIQVWASGLPEKVTTGWKIFPNPGKDFIEISPLPVSNIQVWVRDLSSRTLVYREFNASEPAVINIDELKAGIYLIELTNGRERTTLRWVKE